MSSENNAHTDYAIEASELSKVYHLYNAPSDRLKQLLFGRKRTYFKEYSALNNVSFQLPKGEVLGVVGRNGAGKSTLLQLLCSTLTPTSGKLTINGRIAALLELGAGFNPQFTGRENIYLSATVMGISKKDIDKKIEDIIDFSGVRPFIDQPVTTYSSGMYVRLAFSVATSVEPDILIIDEALSVGDGDFARRSFERIMTMKEAGKTILFCSHSLYQVEALCTQALWLEKGQIKATGKPSTVIPVYQSFLDQLDNRSPQPDAPQDSTTQTNTPPPGDAGQTDTANDSATTDATPTDTPTTTELTQANSHTGARLTRITATADGVTSNTLHLISRSSNLHLDIEFHSTLKDETPQVAIAIHSAGGQLITSCGSWVDNISPEIDAEGNGRIQLIHPQLPLLKGTYYLGVLLFCRRGIFLHDEADPAITLHISQPNQERGLVYLPHKWQLASQSNPEQPNPEQPNPEAPKKAIATQRWQAINANDVSQTSLLALFEQVFGHTLDPQVWRWKYRFADTPGSVVLENKQIVAFTGGIPRKGLVFGQPESMIQMGDVMVTKGVRGILGKKGPFYLASQHYLSPRVGPGLQYSLAFGFPNERAGKVGVIRGIYNIVDKIVEPHWPPLTEANHTNTQIQMIDPHQNNQWEQQVDTLWQAMQQDTNDVAIGCRDSQWVKHRYINKPGADYLLAMVANSEQPNQPLGLLVLNHHINGTMELLDIVGSRDSALTLIEAARQITAHYKASHLFAWATPSALSWFKGSDYQSHKTEVVIPGCNINSPQHALRVKDRWWLLGGDSDFR
ncbi:ATP-binding cassette domain-containing protein [Alkalimarinus alittae]|uniref:ATP-binding cassette domain-containing protein n=1 Tax=Alkalimarinus alittae TaxID=2961619 RepID=A0ABY6MZD3_9ALTE|nr:ATP-binding cassette domain-containing protein [Alkalimarinus alittae]UZE95132.1 ATP-binding cassette domain-containing protein [Alkalimarinus alittae]